MNTSKRFLTVALISLALIVGLCYYYFFTAILSAGDSRYLYIDDDDTVDSVFAKVDTMATRHGVAGFKTIARHMAYGEAVRTGRYEVLPSDCAVTLYRKLRNGTQAPLMLVVPEVRTADRLAALLSQRLMPDSLDFVNALTDSATCATYGQQPTTMLCLFVPNSYEVYWDISVEQLLARMQRESEAFWAERQALADTIGMTRTEVMTLASIIDEETANDAEKPLIAGMYINRLRIGMPLQADPTVKFALQDFTIRRIRKKMLEVDSPYNTYKYAGLPPGPIRIASVAAIDAVLHYVRHDYIYMCAKEDFSGTHRFAATYSEHQQNAARYAKALNARGIE